MDDYLRSIAQNNVRYIIQESYNTNPGANYQKVMIFCGESEADDYFVEAPTAGDVFELNSNSYSDLTKGTLKAWLADFFAGSKITTVFIVIWDDLVEAAFSVENFEAAYTANKTKAYFKMVLSTAHESATLTELCTVAVNDELFTQVWIGTSDATVAIVATILAVTGADAKVVYHSDTDRNPALVQLGVTLSAINIETGFCVGNSVYYVNTKNIDASGTAVDGKGQNILAALRATLEAAKVSFFTYIGDGTEAVAMEGGLTIRGNNAAAKWVEAFIEFVGSIKTAQQITKMNTWRNNDTYQAILLITQTLLDQFSKLGRFQNAKITAPNFNNLPAGKSITVPGAWSSDFIDPVEDVTIYGTLYITA